MVESLILAAKVTESAPLVGSGSTDTLEVIGPASSIVTSSPTEAIVPQLPAESFPCTYRM